MATQQKNKTQDPIKNFLSQNILLKSRQVYEDYLQVSESTFRIMIKDGRFPQGIKIGKVEYRWSLDVVKAWQAKQEADIQPHNAP